MRICKTDGNQRGIVEVFRKAGALVLDLHGVGKGCPDLLICSRGRLTLVEVKSKRGTLTPDQVEFMSYGWPVKIVRSCLEAVDLLNEVGLR